MPNPLDPHLTDEALLARIGPNLARQRVRAGLTQDELARQAGVGKRTVERLEAGESTQLASFFRILRVLGLLPELGALVVESGPSPMELLRMKSKERQRASSGQKKPARPQKKWTWGDSS